MRYLDLVLTPNRALPERQLWWMVAGVAGVMALAALRFVAIGAWPVLPFMVLDVVLLAWALRQSLRASRAVEEVRLDDAGLTVRRVSPGGVARTVTLEPYWARVVVDPISARQNRLWLAARDRRVAIGTFLSAAERIELAPVIEQGLARWRGRF